MGKKSGPKSPRIWRFQVSWEREREHLVASAAFVELKLLNLADNLANKLFSVPPRKTNTYSGNVISSLPVFVCHCFCGFVRTLQTLPCGYLYAIYGTNLDPSNLALLLRQLFNYPPSSTRPLSLPNFDKCPQSQCLIGFPFCPDCSFMFNNTWTLIPSFGSTWSTARKYALVDLPLLLASVPWLGASSGRVIQIYGAFMELSGNWKSYFQQESG